MPGEEYIMSSKACVYVLGGEANTASLFDFDGVYVLDGGFAGKSQGFVANVRECAAVILTAPTAGNLGTTAALLEKGNSLPVFTNTKPLKGAKAGSSGEVVKAIQEANSKLLSPTSLIFDPKYPAHVLYQSYSKGILSLYILAGDAKDAEVLTKALAGGNESEVEKAGAEHGTIGVLLWRPAEAEKPVVRVLVSGNSSLSRIQQSLDKAAKALPFLNAATVKSKDALTAIPAPSIPRSAATNPAARPATAKPPSRPATTTAAPARALTSRAPAPSSRPASKPAVAPARGAPAKPAAPARGAPAKTAAPPARVAPKAPVAAGKTAPAKPTAPRASAEPVALKKTVGKVQGAAPTKTSRPVAASKKDPSPPAPAAAAPVTTPAPVAPAVPVASIVLDDVPIDLDLLPASGDSHQQQPVDIVLIPPTPEPPRHHDDEEEKKEPAAVPEEPLIPQAPKEDGTLADCSEELSKLVEISMDTDKSTEAGTALAEAIGDVTQLAAGIQNLALDEKTDEYVRKLSNQMIEEATMPFTSAFANSIVSEDHGVPQELNGHGATNGVPAAKHDLMQSRSSVVESNGAPVEYEKTDPALDDILNACAQESEKIDSKEVLHMPVAPGTAVVKAVRFARPYYFDVVTAPRNEKLETTASAEGLQEFISKVRSRNVILASKEITGEQLQALLLGKQTWCDGAHTCTIIPTHSSPNLLDFRHRNEEQLSTAHLILSTPVEKQRTTVSSEAGATDYELAKISLE